MRTRTLVLAAASALALAAAGCGDNKCKDETPAVSQVPASCTAVAGSTVTMPVHVCPKCDQGTPTCDAHPLNGGQIVLEPISQVCDPNSSCPLVDPASCPFATMSCSFPAPAVGSYNLVVVTPEGTIQRPLTVVASGPTSCGFP
jgi:hypothetical protein